MRKIGLTVEMAAKRRPRSSQVPGQYLGYSQQTTRALVRLLGAPPGSFVSVEVIDDVAESGPAGDTTLVQAKSVGQRHNPIADRSPELWKTLANWVRAANDGQIDLARTEFELFVSKKRTGAIAHSFHAARTVAEAGTVLTAAQAILNRSRAGSKRRSRMPATLAPHLSLVFANTSVAAEIISRMTLTFGSGRSSEDVLALLRTKVISDTVVDIVAKQMLGWVKQTLDNLIEQHQSAVIATDDFNRELGAFVRRVDRSQILNCFAPPPTKEEVDLELRDRVYVRQLDLIGSDYENKLAAATDFLRASVNRSVWAAKGLAHRTSFAELEDRLKRIWRAKRDAISVQSSHQPQESQGKLLYSECLQVDASIDGRPVPSHFGPGCYHAMADTLEIGWHPQYRERLADTPRDDDDKGGSA